uniref:Uncharacterized protein n=1 Tax=Arundo donax TaxID=35708 RepID=A0A0A9F5B7_ARUDO
MLQCSQTEFLLRIGRNQSQFLIMELMFVLWNTTNMSPAMMRPI